MAKAEVVLDAKGHYQGVSYDCPGCRSGGHFLYTDWVPNGQTRSILQPARPRWKFNGDLERPTFEPSIISRGNYDGSEEVCHHFVRNGEVEFLGDCTHALRGQTVPLPELE